METRRVLIPILALGLCALIVGVYSCPVPTDLTIIDRAIPTPNPPVELTVNPSPTPASLPSPTTYSAIPTTGEHAPDFTLPSTQGEMVTLSSYEGLKNVVLLFYRTGG